MRAIHSHRAHSATSQGVYLSGRRTPGGTSRARRLLATNTALLTSAHRMISPPPHKRQTCTLPTHPPCTTPQNQKLRRPSKRARTPLARSLSPNTPNTKPSLSSPLLLPGPWPIFSLSPLCARRHPERRAEAISPSSRLPRRRQPLDDDGNGRRSDKPRTAHHPAAASHPLHNDTSQRRRRSRHQHATRSPARTHTRTRKQPLSDRKKEAESERKKKKAQRPPTSTHAKHTRPSPLTRTPCAGDTGRASRRHRRRRPWASSQASARHQPRAEQPSQDAATSRAAEPRCSSDVLLLPVPRSTHTPRKHTHARSSPASLAAHTQTSTQTHKVARRGQSTHTRPTRPRPRLAPLRPARTIVRAPSARTRTALTHMRTRAPRSRTHTKARDSV